MNANVIPVSPISEQIGAEQIISMILKALLTAMGVAAIVASQLGALDLKSGFTCMALNQPVQICIYLEKIIRSNTKSLTAVYRNLRKDSGLLISVLQDSGDSVKAQEPAG